MNKSKKSLQLGMNHSTASHKLVKDILFRFIEMGDCKCHRCGEDLTRGTFSIEHIKPWLDSEDPLGLFFDLDNISFSHMSCNYGAARKTTQKFFTDEERRAAHNERRTKRYAAMSKEERQRIRREQYERHGA